MYPTKCFYGNRTIAEIDFYDRPLKSINKQFLISADVYDIKHKEEKLVSTNFDINLTLFGKVVEIFVRVNK